MLKFSKLVGTGNDFIFVDQTKSSRAPSEKVELAQKICDRHFGVGADGIIFVEINDEKLKWDFYNKDGSQAEFCGNAARCFGRWALRYRALKTLVFESVIGEINVHNHGDEFTAQLHKLNAQPKKIEFSESEIYLLNTGVPHFVCATKDELDLDKKLEFVKELRFHPEAGAAGANVTFLSGDKTVTFERGVEDFTLSCGTGVIAAAVCVWKKTGETEISLQTPGGKLSVAIIESRDDVVFKADLIGPADFICEGEFMEKKI